MAVLQDQERFNAWADFMRQQAVIMQLNEPVTGLLKTELRAAINAADSWIDSNAASYNTALPQPARSALNAQQKAALLMYVVARRYLAGV